MSSPTIIRNQTLPSPDVPRGGIWSSTAPGLNPGEAIPGEQGKPEAEHQFCEQGVEPEEVDHPGQGIVRPRPAGAADARLLRGSGLHQGRSRGNHLGVVPDVAGLDTGTMQGIASDLGFSETIFLDRTEAIPAARIFTPEVELPFAGHPLVGAAWVLGEIEAEPPDRLSCPAFAGTTPAQRRHDAGRCPAPPAGGRDRAARGFPRSLGGGRQDATALPPPPAIRSCGGRSCRGCGSRGLRRGLHLGMGGRAESGTSPLLRP